MSKKLTQQEWIDQCNKWGLTELAKSTIHNKECDKHNLFHITKEALKYHKKIMH